MRTLSGGKLAFILLNGLNKSVSISVLLTLLQTASLAALAALNMRLDLATVSDWASSYTIGQAIGLVTLAAVEITSPVRRLVSFELNGFVVGYLKVVKVLKLAALLGL